jgi:hypothetical protein
MVTLSQKPLAESNKSAKGLLLICPIHIPFFTDSVGKTRSFAVAKGKDNDQSLTSRRDSQSLPFPAWTLRNTSL